MNFSIERSSLLDALQKIQSVVEKKNTIQILGNILITAKKQELALCATDLEVGIKILLPADVQQEGKTTLSAKHLLDIVKELPSMKVQISLKENNWVELICGKSKFTIVSLPPDQYPALPSFEDKAYFDARATTLMNMIDRTHFAASTDATRHHLNGVYFECLENSMMRMLATEGHRLSFVDQEVFLTRPDLKRGVVIPKKGLLEFRKLLTEDEEIIGLSFERGYLFVKLNHSYLFVRLIEGDYPDYRPVMPREVNRVIKMDRSAFTSALKRASLLANEKSRAVKLSIQSGYLVISSSNSEIGEAREEVDIQYSGEPLEIAFNSRYLLEDLAVLKTDQLEFHLKDRLSPGILKEVEYPNHTYVIMPMRL